MVGKKVKEASNSLHISTLFKLMNHYCLSFPIFVLLICILSSVLAMINLDLCSSYDLAVLSILMHSIWGHVLHLLLHPVVLN